MIIDSPIISGSYAASGSLNQLGNVVISGSLTVTGSIIGTASFAETASYLSGYVSPFPFTGSAIISGSLEVTGSANLPNITGSLLGTSSFANTSTSSSFASTASFSLNVPVTSSYANNATSASFATTASYLTGYISPFPFTGSAIVSGSLVVTGSVAVSNLQGTGVRYLVADASGSITAQTASAAIKQTQAFTSSANQTSFTIDNGYTTGLVDVFINGTKLAPGVEFTDTSGTVITLATGSNSGDLVEFVKYFPASGVTNNALRQQTTFTASAGQTVFSASYTPGLLDIFYNGSRLSNNEYTANNGTFFTLATGSVDGDILDVFVYSYQVGAFSGIGGVGTADQIAFFGTTNAITGSPNFTISGSTMTVTGSLIVSGSGTFTNIGPAVMSGSLNISGSLTVGGSNVVLSNQTSSLNVSTASFAATASSADNLLVRNTLTAQTLVVQTITSSVDFVTGSTRFGSILGNTHQFTGSVSMTGSLAVVTNGTEFQVNSTGVNLGNALTDSHIISGSLTINSGGLFVSSSGNIGIGTANPTARLDVNGEIRMTGSTLFRGMSSSTLQLCGGLSSSNVKIDGSVEAVTIDTNGAERVRVNSSGTAIFSGGNTADVNNTPIRVLNNRFLTFYNAANTGWAMTLGANTDNTGGIGANAGLYLQTGASLDTRMFIASGGSIGIGTTSPDRRLTINSGASEGAFGLTSNNGVEIDMVGYGTGFSNPQARIKLTDGGLYGGILSFWTKPNGAQANALLERMRISNTGVVTIAAPNHMQFLIKSSISGDASFEFGAEDNVIIGFQMATAASGVTWFTGRHRPGASGITDEMNIYRNATNLFRLQSNGNYSFAGSNVSDIRLKENITTIDYNATEKLLQLVPKSYNMIEHPTISKSGFIAQDIKEILPNFVNGTESENEYLGIDYNGILALAVKAIQEQQTLITALEEKLERNNII